MFYGNARTLGEVRHVPNLKKSLISLRSLDALAYGFSAKEQKDPMLLMQRYCLCT